MLEIQPGTKPRLIIEFGFSGFTLGTQPDPFLESFRNPGLRGSRHLFPAQGGIGSGIPDSGIRVFAKTRTGKPECCSGFTAGS